MRIKPEEMFSLKKGTRVRVKDGRVLELTSDYNRESVSYKCREEGSDTEITISVLTLNGCDVLN